MTSARRPERGASLPHGVPGIVGTPPGHEPGHDEAPAALPPFVASQPSHLAPCPRCGTLNGRSAASCWGCDADLHALAGFGAAAAAEPVVKRPAEPAARAELPAGGRRGLHLVARAGDAASVQAVADTVVPSHPMDLPVLTSFVEGTGWPTPIPPPRPRLLRAVGAALGVLMLAGVTVLWWRAPAPKAANAALPAPATVAPRWVEAPDRAFAEPTIDSPLDRARLSFPPLEVAPETAPVKRATAARPKATAPADPVASKHGGKARPGAAPPPPCTSNMAALGFCTLAPGPAKE